MRSLVLLASSFISFWVQPALGAENFPLIVATYLNRQGPVIAVYLLHSRFPVRQLVVHYCVDEGAPGGRLEGANNASNVHCNIALFNRSKKGKWVYGDEVAIGQGSLNAFDTGVVTGESVTYSSADALCCPSQKTKLRFSTKGGKFVSEPE